MSATDNQNPVAEFFCWAGMAEFPPTRPKTQDKIDEFAKVVKNTIDESRECKAFIKWNPAKSPEEHEKMLELAMLKESQRQDRIAADRGFWINFWLLVATAMLSAVASIFSDQISGYFFPEQPIKQVDSSET